MNSDNNLPSREDFRSHIQPQIVDMYEDVQANNSRQNEHTSTDATLLMVNKLGSLEGKNHSVWINYDSVKELIVFRNIERVRKAAGLDYTNDYEWKSLTFVTDIPLDKFTDKDREQFNIITVDTSTNEPIIEDTDMHFDTANINPPYDKTLHLKFVKLASQYADHVVSLHPSNWLINKTHDKRVQKIEQEVINLVQDNKTSFEWVNGNAIFGKAFHYPLLITSIEMGKEPAESYKFESSLKTKESQEFKSYDDINIWSSEESYLSARRKVIEFSKNNVTLASEVFPHKEDVPADKPYGVQLSLIRGSHCTEELFASDMFTFVPRTVKVIDASERKSHGKMSYWFETEVEAENFIKYLKGDFARFCMHFYKVSCDLALKIVPFLDFTKEWSDEALFDMVNLTDDEKQWIPKVITPYYK